MLRVKALRLYTIWPNISHTQPSAYSATPILGQLLRSRSSNTQDVDWIQERYVDVDPHSSMATTLMSHPLSTSETNTYKLHDNSRQEKQDMLICRTPCCKVCASDFMLQDKFQHRVNKSLCSPSNAASFTGSLSSPFDYQQPIASYIALFPIS